MLEDMTQVHDVGRIIFERQRPLDVAESIDPSLFSAIKSKSALTLIAPATEINNDRTHPALSFPAATSNAPAVLSVSVLVNKRMQRSKTSSTEINRMQLSSPLIQTG